MIPSPPPTPSLPPDPPRPPRALHPGARVALVAPAGPLTPDQIASAEVRVRALGFEPRVAPSAHLRDGFLAGPDAPRLADLQAAFDDPETDAVWALRGGYGCTRIVDALNLRRQLADPIPFIGFSDNTALHARHGTLGIVSFHGPHPGGEESAEADAWLARLLSRTDPPGPVPSRAGDPPARTLAGGVAEGRLVGGNLALLAALCGTRDAVVARGRILVLEDVGEPAYRVDRMLGQLLRSRALDGVAGLAFGRFTEADDDAAVESVLRRYAEELGVPAVIGLPFGHTRHNFALPLGARARLDGDGAQLVLLEAGVTRM